MTVKECLLEEKLLGDAELEIINNGKQIFIGNKEQLGGSNLLDLEIKSYNVLLSECKVIFDVSKN